MAETKNPNQIVVNHSKNVFPEGETYTLYDLQSGSNGWRNFMLKRHKVVAKGYTDDEKSVWRLGWNGRRLAQNADVKHLLEEWDRRLHAWVIASLMMDDIGILLFKIPKDREQEMTSDGIFDRKTWKAANKL